MVAEIVLNLPLTPLPRKRNVVLTTGEVVTIENDFKTTRFVNGRYVDTEDDLFYIPLNPGHKYVTHISYVLITFTFTKQHVSDKRGPNYFYFKHLAELGVVSIGPQAKEK